MLGDVRVLDLAVGCAGSLAATLLGDFGADVVKVVTADPREERGPELPDWLACNRSKRIVVEGPGDQEALDRFACAADLVIVDSEERLRQFGIDPDSVVSSTLVLYTPAYLPQGAPWYGEMESAGLLEAATGIAGYQASYSGGPVASVYPYLVRLQGVWAATCAVAALIEFRHSRRGQSITVSGMHAALIFGDMTFSRPIGEPDPDRGIGPAGLNSMYTRYQCADGKWVFVGGLGPKFANIVLDLVGLRHLLDDPRAGGQIEQLWASENVSWVMPAFAERFRGASAAEWMARLEAADVPCALLSTRDEWFRSEQMAVMNQRLRVADPVLGPIDMTGVIVDSTATPADPGPASAPVSIQELAWHRGAGIPVEPRKSNSAPSGPLDGHRIAVLGSYVAGPLIGRLLTELGASAIKVEPPSGDPWRVQGFGINRGNRSISLNLAHATAREALQELLASCDAVVDNFRIGVMERLGLSHDELAARNPQVVTVGVTAYGERGPLAMQPGYDPVLQAASGMMIAQGGDSEPTALSLPPIDLATALCGAFATTLGLYHRTMTGTGQHLSTALGTTALFFQSSELIDYPDRPAGRAGGRDFVGPSALDRFYSVKDGYVRIQVGNIDPAKWVAAGLDVDETALARDAATEIARILAPLTRDEAERRLKAAAVPAAAARTSGEVAVDEELHDLGVMSKYTTTQGVDMTLTGRFVFFDRTEVHPLRITPGLGEHSIELLAEADVSAESIERMVAEGLVIQGSPMDIVYLPPYR
ncbi:CoA transferase [Nocardia sp. NPDC050378]|uniref:CaiB/BaiF CoA-transferase family protein n=1 Tax=Nocardia sp. NPDC050378 TaxID=3155400 RepID=UPI0033F4E652